MPRRKKIETEEPVSKRRLPTYRIKHLKEGFDLLQDGAWLGTYDTEAEAQAERAHRAEFDRIRGSSPI